MAIIKFADDNILCIKVLIVILKSIVLYISIKIEHSKTFRGFVPVI